MDVSCTVEPQNVSTRPRPRGRATQQFPCPICGDVFSRIDHLSRHMRSHNPEKTFLCEICGKGFIRADSLSRHARGHDGVNSQKASYRPKLIVRVPMACQKCCASKLRCDGSQPCKRCSDKKLQCTYVKRSRRRVKEGPIPLTTSQVNSPASEGTTRMSETPQMDTITLNTEVSGSVDARALDTLSQAAMQARTPPIQITDIDRQTVDTTNYLAIHTPNSGKVFLPQSIQHSINDEPSSVRDNINYEPSFGPAISPISNITNEMNTSWATGETLNQMSFDGTTTGGHDDRVNDISNLENLVFAPLWDTSLLLTDWTTLDYDFNIDMSHSFPEIDHRPHGMNNQQLGTPAFFDEVRASNPFFSSSIQSQAQSSMLPDQPYGTMNAREKDIVQDNGIKYPTSRIVNESATTTSHAHQIVPERECERRDDDDSLSRTAVTRYDPKPSHAQWPTDWDPGKTDNVLSLPDLHETPRGIFEAENFSHVPRVSQHVYDSIVYSIDQTSRDKVLFKPFLNSPPPSLEALNCFVQLYFEHFQPVFPLLHQPTFDPTSAPWVLVLAVAAIGCRYSKIKDSAKCATALEELLRRAIQHGCEHDNSTARKLWLAQAMALNMVGMLYSGDKRLLELAMVIKGGLVTTCSRNSSLKAMPQSNKIDENLEGRHLESAWKLWQREESYRRLGFCCWLLDCQLPLYFDTNPTMNMHEIQQQLPCKEELWEAPDKESWKFTFLQFSQHGSTQNMHSALQVLSNQDELSPAIGDFGRLILTHAVFMTTWDMRQQAKNPLLQGPSFLSRENRYFAWQNIASSTLDEILPSRPDFGRGPVLQLILRAHVHHVALLVHVPLGSLLAYARSQAANQGIQKAHQELLIWMKEDNGRKARHAVLHASILFSLIREQPCRGFHEPIALLIATLTLWAFHQLSYQQSLSTNNQEPRATVRLDRAHRTQAALSWVENGADLRGYLTDVGNICGPGAGKRMLQLSCRSLAAMDAWALSQGFLHVLSTLESRQSDAPCS